MGHEFFSIVLEGARRACPRCRQRRDRSGKFRPICPTPIYLRSWTSGKVASSRTKFGGMAVPAAQLDLGRLFQEKLSCPFDERREIFVCEDGALVPEQISFYFHFRELVVGVDGVAESLIAIQSGLKFDCRHPAKAVMLGRVLRPASAVRPTGELAAFLVFRIGRHRQSSVTANHCLGAATVLVFQRADRA